MKKITLLLITFFAFSLTNGQVYQQDYESYAIGATQADTGNQMEKGTGTVQIATASGNSTQVLRCVHNSGQNDMFVRSGNFGVQEGEIYNVSIDVSSTIAVYVVTMRYTQNDDFNTAVARHPDTPITSTNGAHEAGTNFGVLKAVNTTQFGTTTATFTVPAGFNSARLQIYQFGSANVLEIDNFTIELDQTASVSDLAKFNFKSFPNPVKDRLYLYAQNNINNVEIYSLLGKRVMQQTLNQKTAELNISHLSNGVYIIKASIEDAVGSYKFVKE